MLAIMGGVIILVGAIGYGGYYYYLTHRHFPVPESVTYHAENYSFSYPGFAPLHEYSRGNEQVGYQDKKTFVPLIDVMQYTSDPDAALPSSYTAYIGKQAQYLCGSDGPDSVTCSSPKIEPFTTTSGVAGSKISLTLTRTNLSTGAIATSTYAPIYAFNMTKPATKDRAYRYDALFIYPSLSAQLVGTSSPVILDRVVNSLKLGS